jgi:hypothetical protein
MRLRWSPGARWQRIRATRSRSWERPLATREELWQGNHDEIFKLIRCTGKDTSLVSPSKQGVLCDLRHC